MICECDAAFARANEKAHREMSQPAVDSTFNYFNYQFWLNIHFLKKLKNYKFYTFKVNLNSLKRDGKV